MTSRARLVALPVTVLLLVGCGSSDGEQADDRSESLIATALDDSQPEPEGSADGSQSVDAGGTGSNRDSGIVPSAEGASKDNPGIGQNPDRKTATDGSGDGTEGSGGAGGEVPATLAPASNADVEPTEQEADTKPDPGLDIEPLDIEGGTPTDPASADRADVNYPADVFTDLVSGAQTDLAAEAAASGNVVLLWFWSPGSPPSLSEAAVAERFADTHGDKVTVIAVGVEGDRAGADLFREQSELSTTVLWSPSSVAREHYRVDRVPSSILLGQNGDVIARWHGLPREVFSFAERMP